MKNKFYFKPFGVVLKSNQANDICMCYDDYFQFLKLKFADKYLEPITKRYDLKRGLYGNINNINIWVSKNIASNYIKVYPKDKVPENNNDLEWSPDIKTSDFEKIIKLKAFW